MNEQRWVLRGSQHWDRIVGLAQVIVKLLPGGVPLLWDMDHIRVIFQTSWAIK